MNETANSASFHALQHLFSIRIFLFLHMQLGPGGLFCFARYEKRLTFFFVAKQKS